MAAILLIVIAVIGAVLLYVWFTGFLGAATGQASRFAVQESLKIDAVSLSASPPALTVYVRNLGGVPVVVSSVYVADSVTGNAVCGATSLSEAVEPYSVSELTPTMDCGSGLSRGRSYVVKVVTQRGTEAATVAVAG